MPDFTERFWSKVTKTDGCWEWNAFTNADGYGKFRLGNKLEQAHRVSFALVNGEIPAGLLVLHRCDNPPCVRPSHLFLGTYLDNNRDRVQKGRDGQGKRTHCKHGHEFTPENMGKIAIGRRCLTCTSAATARYNATRKKAA